MRQEQIEMAEKRQREIYLNGGFVDCVNSGILHNNKLTSLDKK